MKNQVRILGTFFLFLSLVTASCKKNENIPVDKMSDIWNVTEVQSGDTVYYSASITRKDETHIVISFNRSNAPFYHYEQLEWDVDWANKKLKQLHNIYYGYGTIRDENNFETTYYYPTGSSGTVYLVQQLFSR